MKINVTYLVQNSFLQERVTEAAAVAELIMSSQPFLDQVAAWPGFTYTAKTPQQIADDIRNANIDIKVGFYLRRLTRAIAYEVDGAVYFNRAKIHYGAGSPGNVAHEVMHALGYRHNGNSRSGNENTVPYRIGDWVDHNEGAAVAVAVAEYEDKPELEG